MTNANLATFFRPINTDGTRNPLIDFGGKIKDSDGNTVSELALSDISNVARDTAGVRKLDLPKFLINLENDDLTLAPREFPMLGTVVIVDGDTGAEL